MLDYFKNTKTDIDFEQVKRRALEIEQTFSKQRELFKRFREIYFMDNIETPKNAAVDPKDWKLTASPSGRNEVTGMKRLMDTAEINVTIKVRGKTVAESDLIEEGLKSILRVSGQMKRARVEKDANLSAVLWGPVVLQAESLDDLITVQKKPTFRRRLEQIKAQSPFIISVMNAEESYPDWGKFGLLAHVQKYTMRGAEMKEAWGLTDCKDNQEYTVHDYYDMENRVVWSDQHKQVIYEGPHKLHDIPIAVRYTGGSSLFYKPEEQLQSFLFAKAKGEWDKRENLLWTYIFTAIYQQGLPGRTMLFESIDGSQPTVDIDFASGIKRVIVQGAKASTVDMSILDSDVMQIKQMMDDVSGESTIRGQTLGENINAATFSALAMLSSAGKLPLIDPQEAVQSAFSDIFTHILYRIKDEGIENELIPASLIPDDFEVLVQMEAKLPQDNLRNAQIAAALGDMVSKEWIREKLLQISNSTEMDKQIALEKLEIAMLMKISQDPQYIDQFIKSAMGMPAQPQPPQGMPPQGMPQGMPPQEMEQPPMQEQGMSPEQAMMMQQGGGMEQPPQTDAMIPPQERM